MKSTLLALVSVLFFNAGTKKLFMFIYFVTALINQTKAMLPQLTLDHYKGISQPTRQFAFVKEIPLFPRLE